MDIRTTAGLIDLAVNAVIIILMIVAASMAINKKNNLALMIAVLGNLIVYYFTESPLLCGIISIAVIIWMTRIKNKEENQSSVKQTTDNNPKKIGNIIGLILGIGFVAGPLIAYFGQEASISNSTTQGVLILFAVIGGFMIMNNLFKLFENPQAPQVSQIQQKPLKAESEKSEEKMIRCRFCKKRYSTEYNGCPYCKKK